MSVNDVDRDVYARDMWPRLLIARRGGVEATIGGGGPDAIVWPESAREVAAVVKYAREAGLPIVPYGGGSGVCGGAVPVFGGITIDTKRMTQLRSVSTEELVCDVEGGINGERFERELARRGLTFGNFPSSIYCSTVGGWLATRAAGQLSTKYGKVEDRVSGLTLVTGKGDIVDTDGPSRAMRGPNWTQLLLGSEGTLGIITSARLRVSLAPQIRIFRGYSFDSLQAGLRGIQRVVQRGLRPAVVRLYDEFDTLINKAHFGGDADDQDHDEFSAARAGGGYHGLGKNHREFDESHAPSPAVGSSPLPLWPSKEPADERQGLLARLRGFVRSKGNVAGNVQKMADAPNWTTTIKRGALGAALGQAKWVNAALGVTAEKLARTGCRMIIGFEGARIRSEVEAALAFAELESAGGRDQGEGPGWAWYEHRYAVSYRMSPMFRDGAFVDTMEVAGTWEQLHDLYHEVRAAIGRHAIVMAHFSHAYSEGCSIYFTFVGGGQGVDAATAEKSYDAIWRDGMQATTRVGGTISHHHGVGLLKAPYMRAEHREAMTIFDSLKASLDPDGIMNPGKMGLSSPWDPLVAPSVELHADERGKRG